MPIPEEFDALAILSTWFGNLGQIRFFMGLSIHSAVTKGTHSPKRLIDWVFE